MSFNLDQLFHAVSIKDSSITSKLKSLGDEDGEDTSSEKSFVIGRLEKWDTIDCLTESCSDLTEKEESEKIEMTTTVQNGVTSLDGKDHGNEDDAEVVEEFVNGEWIKVKVVHAKSEKDVEQTIEPQKQSETNVGVSDRVLKTRNDVTQVEQPPPANNVTRTANILPNDQKGIIKDSKDNSKQASSKKSSGTKQGREEDGKSKSSGKKSRSREKKKQKKNAQMEASFMVHVSGNQSYEDVYGKPPDAPSKAELVISEGGASKEEPTKTITQSDDAPKMSKTVLEDIQKTTAISPKQEEMKAQETDQEIKSSQGQGDAKLESQTVLSLSPSAEQTSPSSNRKTWAAAGPAMPDIICSASSDPQQHQQQQQETEKMEVMREEKDEDAEVDSDPNAPTEVRFETKMAQGVTPQWCLVEQAECGLVIPLPTDPATSIFLGREECDIILQSRSVERKHAELTLDIDQNKFRLQDLRSNNGTFVNETRISEQKFVMLEQGDTLRFGYDQKLYEIHQMDSSGQPIEIDRSLHPGSPTRELPSWAMRDAGPGLAECPGCIAEQGIQHTCQGVHEDCPGHHHQHQHQHHQQHHQQHHEHHHHGGGTGTPPIVSTTTAPPGATLQNGHGASSEGGIAYSRWQDSYHPTYQPEYSSYPVEGSGVPLQSERLPPQPQASQDRVDYLFSQNPRILTVPPTAAIDPAAVIQATPFPPHAGPHGAHEGPCCQVIHHVVYPAPHPQLPGHSHSPAHGHAHTHPPHYILAQPTSFSEVIHSHPTGGSTVSKVTHPPPEVSTSSQPSAAHEHQALNKPPVQVQQVLSKPPPHPEKTSPHPVSSSVSSSATTTTAPVSAVDTTAPPAHNPNAMDTSAQLTPSVHSEKEEVPAAADSRDGKATAESSPKTLDSPGSPSMVRRDKRRSLTGTEADLKTVHKGSSLYGPPSWWGDEDSYSYPHTATLTNNNNAEGGVASPDRPSSLPLEANNNKNGTSAKNGMDIPQRDLAGDVGAQNHGTHTPPERDPGPGEPTQNGVEDQQKKTSPLAFTVVFDQPDDDRQMGTKDSMSNFMPNKLRESLTKRSKRREKEEKAKKGTEGQMSPARQRKSEPSWSSGSPSMRRKAGVQQKSGYLSDGHNSALSSDNEDLSTRSDTSSSKAKRRASQPNRSSNQKVQDRKPPASRTPKMERRAKSSASTTKDSSHGLERMRGSKLNTSIDSAVEPTEYAMYSETRSFGSKGRTSLGASVPKPTQSALEPFKSVRRSPRSPRNQEDVPDNTSETGTYTIEGDEENEEVSLARESIDEAFGISRDSQADDGQDTDHDVENDLENETAEDGHWEPIVEDGDVNMSAGSLQAETGSSLARVHLDDEDEEVHSGQQDISPGEAPKWIREWAPHASDSAVETTPGDVQFTSRDSSRQQVRPSSGSGSRKTRPGSGRVLPTPPVRGVQSQESTRGSFDFSKEGDMEDIDDTGGRRRATVTFDTGDEGGFFTVSYDAPTQHPLQDDDTVISDVTSTDYDDPRATQSGSARSMGSIDTDVLLEPTEFVVQAMSERIQKKTALNANTSSRLHSDANAFRPIHDDTDSDASSNVCVIDGDVDTPRTPRTPPLAPRDVKSGQRRTKTDSRRTTSTRSSPTKREGRKVSEKDTRSSGSKRSSQPKDKDKSRQTAMRRSKSVPQEYDNYGPAEGYSESDPPTDSSSIISSTTDYSYCESLGSPKMIRRGSAGKGKVPMVKQNKTFALRRSRAEEANNSESSTTISGKSRPSSAGGSLDSARSKSRSRSTSRSRPSSGRESSRTAATTDRSDVSLGQKIVIRSRQPAPRGSELSDRSSKSFSRSDGGRHSLRATAPPSVASKQTTSSRSKDTRTRSTASPRSSGGLSITGSRAAENRSTSPRTQSHEKSAWEKRKGYDPRKAVADSKSGKSSGSSSRTKGDGSTTSSKLRNSRSKSVSDEVGRRHQRSNRSVSSVSSEEQSVASEDTSRSEDILTHSRVLYNDLNALTKDLESESDYGLESSRRASSLSRLLSKDLSGSAFSIPSATSASAASSRGRERQSRSPRRRNLNARSENAVDKMTSVGEGYESVVLSSIQMLAEQISGQTSHLFDKLKEQKGISRSPSPVDERLPEVTEELSHAVHNLRRTQRRLQAIDKALFPPRHSPERTERIRPEVHFEPIQKPMSLNFQSSSTWRTYGQRSQDSSSDPFEGSNFY